MHALKELLENLSATSVLEKMLDLQALHSPGEEKDSLKSELKVSLQNVDIERTVREQSRGKCVERLLDSEWEAQVLFQMGRSSAVRLWEGHSAFPDFL